MTLPHEALPALATALGVGLMIGVVRERTQTQGTAIAGTRTHALLALLGSCGLLLGPLPFLAAFIAIAALNVVSYQRSAAVDPGLTGEVAVIATFLLGGLAARDPALAAGLGVLIAILLHAKQPLRRLSREWIRDSEVRDGLMLAAAALVVMPLLPDHAVDPWGVLKPVTVWRIVVLVMAVGMAGHLAMRAAGPRVGLPIAGFFAGFASSTAAVASFGERARRDRRQALGSAASALLANLASLLLLIAVITTVSPVLLSAVRLPFAAAAATLALAAVALLRQTATGQSDGETFREPEDRAFRLSHALFIAVAIAGVLLLSAWLTEQVGETGAIAVAMVAALAELHAAGVSLAQLVASGGLNAETASWGAVAILGSSALAKSVLACLSGGRRYGLAVSAGLIAMAVAAALTTWLTG